MLTLAVFNIGQEVQKDDDAVEQARRVQALYIALAQEQAAIRQIGAQPVAPDPSVILNQPEVVLDKNLAGGIGE